MGLTRAEQETVFRWDEDAKIVHVYSASPVTWRRMARLGFRYHHETTTNATTTGRFYRVPLAEFRWGRKRRGVPAVRAENLTRRARPVDGDGTNVDGGR